ncbi:MAG TPA: protein-glutamate O-methyltransferase CheR [Devosia sp.]|nr:protein-glutamate O-methyltransferase CheR [Devosia sp.]
MNTSRDFPPEARFRNLIESRFGLRFDDSKLGYLGDLLMRRTAARQVPVETYLALVGEDAAEHRALAEELTVGETYFFRNADQFRAFSEIVLPRAMQAAAGPRELSFLSAGCSSGEEPYTLAMLVREAVPMPPWQVSIRAVDLNPAALRRATAGRYSSWSLREMPARMQEKWLTGHGRDMQISSELRGMVRFDCRNLADPDSDIFRPGAYDAIFCRNVIMYFGPATQHAVISRLAQSLKPGGYLFLGHAETLRGLSQDFHLVHTHDTFYYQRREAGDLAPSRHYVDLPAASFELPPLPAAAAPDLSWYTAIGEASRRIETLVAPKPPLPPEPRPQPPGWAIEAVLELLQRERFSEALSLIARRPDSVAADPDVLLLEALLLAQDGQITAARAVCNLLLAQDEMSSGANYILGLCFEGEGDGRRAVHHYGIAAHLDPQFAMPRLRRGLLARRAGKLAEARENLGEALDLLQREDTSRLLLFGGGFTRGGLSTLCQSELRACEAAA